ncbi:hypothetical protein AURDEDRAFT_109811 [Auricularia subglabra TFB-10046 SS5]|nr:hypothetical protein AURDEDRAFT_109811 [Auricularia subglabra TFB-10046 SS5]
MRAFTSSSIAVLAIASSAAAHFELKYPAGRGFVADKEPEPICGGFPDVSANRTEFPLKDGVVFISSHHPHANIYVAITLAEAPTKFDEFNATTNPGKGGTVNNYFRVTSEGDLCWNTDISALKIDGATDGANATIQVIYDGGDSLLYQCADIILSANATSPDQPNCKTVDTTQAPVTGGDEDHDHDHDDDSGTSTPPNAGMKVSASQFVAGVVALAGMALAL